MNRKPDLDDPVFWRAFAVRVLSCPFWVPAAVAEQEGVDPHRAAAKAATYCHLAQSTRH
jgi:hypothetical protein